MISMDNYYHDFVSEGIDPETVNYDAPESFDLEYFAVQLQQLKEGEQIEMPVYDFTTHSRFPDTLRIRPGKLVLVEGLFLFNIPEIADIFHLKIFMDTEKDKRLLRRLQRDTQERGRTKESVILRFNTFVQPMHKLYIVPNRALADLIISGDGESVFDPEVIIRYLRD